MNYKKYCYCWNEYLHRINEDKNFQNYLLSKLPWIISVTKWPTVSPSTINLFKGPGMSEEQAYDFLLKLLKDINRYESLKRS